LKAVLLSNFILVKRLSTFLLFSLFAVIGLKAQDYTLQVDESGQIIRDTLYFGPEKSKLMIIPFEPRLYRSHVDRQIGEHDGLSFQEIRGYFRLGLDNALALATKDDYDIVRMHADKADINKDLDYIYKSVGYQYRKMPTPPEPPKKGIAKISDKINKEVKKQVKKFEDPEPTPGARIENGQVVSVAHKEERFMAISLINQDMFNYLSGKYGTGLFLFITQLDIMNAPGQDYTAFGADDYEREIKLHFCIMTSDKKELYAGAVKRRFSSRTNSIKKIIVENFPPMAEQIKMYLPIVLSQENQKAAQVD
jgi:hypothetical protein